MIQKSIINKTKTYLDESKRMVGFWEFEGPRDGKSQADYSARVEKKIKKSRFFIQDPPVSLQNNRSKPQCFLINS
jgi:hypothetical protein